MAIEDIITGGFGTFSSVNMIPTLGFTAGDVVVTQIGEAADVYRVGVEGVFGRHVVVVVLDARRPQEEDATFATYVQAPLIISDVVVSNTTSATATITWTTDIGASSQVEYGLTVAYGTLSAQDPDLVTEHLDILTGLTAGTEYHYRVITVANDCITRSADGVFTTVGLDASIISDVIVSDTTAATATITWTTDIGASSQVEYGLTGAYGAWTVVNEALVTSHEVQVTGLAADTLYHYHPISVANTQITNGSDDTFTTDLPSAAVISAVSVDSYTYSTATISWTTDIGATSRIQYGLTTAYESTTAQDLPLVTSHSQQLTGLTPNTLYHYQVISVANDQTSYSVDDTFTTSAAPYPIVSAVAVSDFGATTADITWTTDIPASSRIEYGLTASYGFLTTLNPDLETSHHEQISGLSAATLYHYRVLSAYSGNTTYSNDGNFTTSGDVIEPGAIVIDAAWLTANGPAPYTLSTAGAIYALQTDVTVDHRAFTISASNVTLSLHGYVITYDNAAGAGLANPGFETQGVSETVPANWDVTDAGTGVRASNATAAFEGAWHFEFDLSNADQTIVSDWCQVPASHLCCYHAARGLQPSGSAWCTMQLKVEHSVLGVVGGFHSYVNHIDYFQSSATAGNHRLLLTFVYEARSTWQAATAYQVGDWVIPTAASIYHCQVLSIGGVKTASSGAVEPTWPTTLGATVVDNKVTWKCDTVNSTVRDTIPIWVKSTAYPLDGAGGDLCRRKPTVDNGCTYVSVRLNIAGGLSGTTQPVWPTLETQAGSTRTDNNLVWKCWLRYGASVDMSNVTACSTDPGTAATDDFGVHVNAGASYAKITSTVAGGSILQGVARGFNSHAIRGRANYTEVSNVILQPNGGESGAVYTTQCSYVSILNCNITASGRWKFIRNTELAAITFRVGSYNVVRGCTIDTGPYNGGGVYFGSTGNIVDGNTITTRCVLTNNFAITTYAGTYCEITNNIIVCDPGQGILIDSGVHHVTVDNNTITMLSVSPDPNGGAISFDGIRLNDYGDNAHDVTCANNVIVGYGYSNPVTPVAQRMSGMMVNLGGINNLVDNNTITMHNVGDPLVTLEGLNPGGQSALSGRPTYSNNVIASDETIILFGHYTTLSQNITLSDHTFVKGDNPKSTFATIKSTVRGNTQLTGVTFVGAVLQNGASLRNPVAYGYLVYDYSVQYRLTIYAKDSGGNPLEGATIVVKSGGEVVDVGSPVTDETGYSDPIVLHEFDLQRTAAVDSSADFSEYNPYTIEVTYGAVMQDEVITLDSDTTLTFTFT